MLRAMVAGLLSMIALVPAALAQDERSMDRGQWRRERAERPPLPGPRGDAPRPQPAGPDRVGVPAARDDAPSRADRLSRDGRAAAEAWRRGRIPRADGLPRPPAPDGAWRSDRAGRDDRRPDSRPDGVWRSERAEPRRHDVRDRPGPPAAVWRSGRDDRWDRSWRREPRYDWQGHRAARRSDFRLPRYYAPGGWNGGYRRFGVGVPLAPVLYAPRYWIDDPYAYRLPDAGEPLHWIRYYDDALLVDIESGTVVDAIQGIFG